MNALRHGLTAEVLVPSLEDADEYDAFQAQIATDFRPQSSLEQHLVARLASLLWRLRRASLIETGLYDIQGRILRQRRRQIFGDLPLTDIGVFQKLLPEPAVATCPAATDDRMKDPKQAEADVGARRPRKSDLPTAFLRLCHLEKDVIDRLGRYETAIWRQAVQLLLLLDMGRRDSSKSLRPASLRHKHRGDRCAGSRA